MAMGRSGEFLYVGCSPDNSAITYAIDPGTGFLTQVQSVAAVYSDPAGMSLDAAGEFLAVANSGSDTISMLMVIEDGGGLSQVDASPFPGAANPSSIAITPNGKYVYTPDSVLSKIYAHKVDPDTGALTDVSGSPLPAGDPLFGAKVSPDSKYLYVTSSSGAKVYSYKIGNKGGLSETSAPSITTPTGPQGIDVGGKSGKFVYTANSTAGNVSGFARNTSNGNLTQMSASPWGAGSGPWDLVIVNVLK
jgi:6-phosphogluconolactonase (cycloisomerase 2 family)